MTIRVAIADDHALVRAGFRVLIGSAPDLEVVGEAGTGEEAVEVVRREQPDVVLMDIQMPGGDGIEATRRALREHPVRVLVLTTFDHDEYVFGALRAGASGFLLKDTPPADLLAAIRVVASGEALLAPSVTRRLIAEFTRRPAGPGPDDADRLLEDVLPGVTEREREVLLLIGRGRSNAEIAEELALTVGTVKTHVSRMLTKLGARDRTQLVILAYESGLMSGTRGAQPR